MDRLLSLLHHLERERERAIANTWSCLYLYIIISMKAVKMTYINTTKISLFDTGVCQEGIDKGYIHSHTLKYLLHFWGERNV